MLKKPPANEGDIRDTSLIPGWGRSPGRGHGNQLQYSCLENPMDRGAWRATVHGVAKSRTRLKKLSTHTHMYTIKLLTFDFSFLKFKKIKKTLFWSKYLHLVFYTIASRITFDSFTPRFFCTGAKKLHAKRIPSGAPLVAQTVKNLPAMWETQFRSLGWEDPLEMGMTTYSY